MLIIRHEQMNALRLVAQDRFEQTLAHHLVSSYPAQALALGEEGLHDFARRAIIAAREHGVDTHGGVTGLAELLIEFGEEFQWSPVDAEAMEILRDPTLPGEIKVTLLQECLLTASGGRSITRV